MALFKLDASCAEISGNTGILLSENVVGLDVRRKVGFSHLVFQEYGFVCL